VIVLDANVLLYAYNRNAPQHAAASAWLARQFRGMEAVGIPWTTLWAFLRVSTNPKMWPNPKSTDEAFEAVRDWLEQPVVILLNPGPRHAELLEELVTSQRAIGPLVSDAVVAALAIEHGAVLASTDRDFSRFPNLRWIDPLVA
jgi:toxin-antitoxin system PIN domain toxin